MSRSLLLGAAVAALVAVAAVPAVAGAAPGARAAAATCPGTFTVLHSDHIGAVGFPAGQYRIARNRLSCSSASQLFSRFLEDYDGVLPTPWKLIGNIRRFQKTGTATEFQVTPMMPPKPSSLTCPGTFTVLHNDHVGAMSVPAGRWQITLLSTTGLSCAQAASQLATFLDYDWSGALPRPWTMNVAHAHVPDVAHQRLPDHVQGREHRRRRASPGQPPGGLPDVPRARTTTASAPSSCRRARTTCGRGARSPAGRRPQTSGPS